MSMSNHGRIRLKTRLLNVHVKSWLNTLKERLLNVHVKSWLNTLKDKVAKYTCQIMVEYA